ncbi:MAG TPA: MATE family efflux transporter [Clostridia bacterium]|nr:MATE family efflux transporter [Clostridia bacterium]
MSAFVSDKGFYKQLAMISIPIALQNLISFGMNMMDTVMLGSLGENQISASSLANQPFFVFTLFMFGLTSGACVLTAQYWGKGDTHTIGRILMLATKASVGCALFFSAVVILFPRPVMSIYTQDPAVIELGAQFLRIIGFSYVISAITTTYLFILRSVENVRLPLLINFISFVANTGLNWVLIYGKLGFAPMGIRGSAVATLSARILELIMTLVYAYFFDRQLSFRLGDLFKADFGLVRDFLHYSLPVVLNETIWGLGITLQSVIIGHMGSEEVAANSIASVVQRLASVVVFGMANAAAVIVGKQIGSGQKEKAAKCAKTILVLSMCFGVASSLLIFLISGPFLSIYHVSETTRIFAMEIMQVFMVTVIFNAFNSVNIVGVLRGGGDTRFAMIIDTGALWLLALPLGALAGLYFKLPLRVVFFLMLIDEPTKFLIGIARFKSGKWLRNVTREQLPEE